MLLVLTYRSDEIPPELAAFLAALERERLAAELTLTGLTMPDVADVVRSIVPAPGLCPATLSSRCTW